MINELSYDEIILAYCSNSGNFLTDPKKYLDSRFKVALVLSIKGSFSEYQEINEEIENEQKGKEDRLFYLEAKINFYTKKFSGQVFSAKPTAIQKDYITMCNEALALHPSAFFASMGLARIFEVQGKNRGAYNQLLKIWDYGFQSLSNYDSLIYISLIIKEWDTTKRLLNLKKPIIYRILLRGYYLGKRYRIYDILFILILSISLIIKPWIIFLGILIFIFLIILGLSYRFNSRAIFVMALSRIVEVIVIILVKLIVLRIR